MHEFLRLHLIVYVNKVTMVSPLENCRMGAGQAKKTNYVMKGPGFWVSPTSREEREAKYQVHVMANDLINNAFVMKPQYKLWTLV